MPQAALAGEVAALSGSILTASMGNGSTPLGIRLEARKPDVLILSAYNSRDHAEFLLSAVVEEEGTAVVSADRAFPSLVASLSGQDLVLETAKGNTALSITAKGAEYSVPTLLSSDWPVFPDHEQASARAEISTEALLKGIQKASKSAANNDPKRPILEGMLMEVGADSLVLSSTDTYRISVRQVPAKCEGEDGCVVHSRSLDVLSKMAKLLSVQDSVLVAVESGRRVTFEQPGRFRLSSSIMGDRSKFPNIAAVLPKEFAVDMLFDRKEFLAAHRRVALFVGDAYLNPVDMSIDDLGVMKMSASQNASSVGTAQETLASVSVLSFEGDEDYHIKMNSRLLADGLGLVEGDSIRVRCTAKGTQVMIFTEAGAEFPGSREFYLALAIRQ